MEVCGYRNTVFGIHYCSNKKRCEKQVGSVIKISPDLIDELSCPVMPPEKQYSENLCIKLEFQGVRCNSTPYMFKDAFPLSSSTINYSSEVGGIERIFERPEEIFASIKAESEADKLIQLGKEYKGAIEKNEVPIPEQPHLSEYPVCGMADAAAFGPPIGIFAILIRLISTF